jgi:PST family polysaccharide transporter
MNSRKVGSKKELLRNVLILYGVRGCTYLLPLVTFPYLARVLRPEGLGAVIFSQTIGGIIAIGVEYGFDFSATRETARLSSDKKSLRDLISGVLAAKLLLALVGIMGAVFFRPYILRVAPSDALFWASTLWGVAQGINMLWYFQGQQRMNWAGGLDIGGKIVATLSIFVFVHQPADGWKVMAAQAAGCSVSHAITIGIAYREVGLRWPSARLTWQALRLGWSMFLFRAAQYLTTANAVILGVFATSTAVGLFAGAEKFRQVAAQGLWPINQALFPHQSQLVNENRTKALRMVRKSLALLGVLSSIFGLSLIFGAPVIVRLVLGAAFMPAVPVLRVLGVLVPLQALCDVISFQWMLPLRLDRQFNLVILTSGIGAVAMGILLAPPMGALGVAIAVTIAQMYALIAILIVLRRRGLSPFQFHRQRRRRWKLRTLKPSWNTIKRALAFTA